MIIYIVVYSINNMNRSIKLCNDDLTYRYNILKTVHITKYINVHIVKPSMSIYLLMKKL